MAVAAVMCIFSANATKHVVWSGDELAADEVQIPSDWYEWWRAAFKAVDDTTSPENGKALEFAATDGTGGDASCGIYVGDNGNVYDMNLLAPCDLVFYVKAQGTGNYTLRLTGENTGDVDQSLTITADGEWHQMRLNIEQLYNKAYAKWASDGAQNGYVFAIVGSGMSADAKLHFYDIHYEAAVAMPEITASAANITSNSADIVYSVTFPEGYTNTKITVNGEDADAAATINATGLEPKTAYTYTIVATGELNGETYSAEKAVTFSTLRELGDTPVWYGETTDVDGFYALYSIIYNADKTLTVEATFETEKETPAADRNFHIFVGGNEWLKLYDDGTGLHTGTTTSTFEEGSVITWEWYLPYAGGVYQKANQYTVGSSNEKPVTAPRVKAEAKDITAESAVIAYRVEVPAALANATITVYVDGKEYTELTGEVPFTGLEEATEYTCDVYATATLGDDTYTSKTVTVTYKTARKDAVDLVYADYVKAELKNAYLIGEDASMARTMYFSLPFSVTLAKDGTAKYEIDLAQIADVVGLNPQIYWNGFKQLTKNEDSGKYEYSFGAQTEGENAPAISHYLAYAGGVIDQNFGAKYPTWGTEQELPAIGEATIFEMVPATTTPKLDTPFIISMKVADANGYYIAADEVKVTTPDHVSYADGLATIDLKGDYTIEGAVGTLSAAVNLTCAVSAESKNLIAGIKPYDFDAFTAEGAEGNLTDENDGSEAIWNCADTEEHHMYFDLGKEYDIELVSIVWEGAYAADYKVVFSKTALGTAPEAMAAVASNHTIEVTGNNTTTPVHYIKNTDGAYDALTARYVGVETTKALNKGWGIKPRELRVFGDEAGKITGIENVAVDNNDSNAAPVYYNLQGVRVERPAAGIYIMVRGDKTSKVLVK